MRQRVRQLTLSMGALLVLPQRYSVYQVRSGRKQPEQTTCVPGCSWQGPHPFVLPIILVFSVYLVLRKWRINACWM